MSEQEEKKPLNLFQKLLIARKELSEMKLKKTGVNKSKGYTFFKLEDFMDAVIEVNFNNGIIDIYDEFPEESLATLTIYDTDNVDNFQAFQFKYDAGITPTDMLNIQWQGAVQTYCKRYLYTNAYSLSASDVIDTDNLNDYVQESQPIESQTRKIEPPQNPEYFTYEKEFYNNTGSSNNNIETPDMYAMRDELNNADGPELHDIYDKYILIIGKEDAFRIYNEYNDN